MRRVRTIALYRRIRAHIPVKLLLLAAAFLYSTSVIHYPYLLAQLSSVGFAEKVSFVWGAFVATSAYKMGLIAIMTGLAVSLGIDAVRDAVHQRMAHAL